MSYCEGITENQERRPSLEKMVLYVLRFFFLYLFIFSSSKKKKTSNDLLVCIESFDSDNNIFHDFSQTFHFVMNEEAKKGKKRDEKGIRKSLLYQLIRETIRNKSADSYIINEYL